MSAGVKNVHNHLEVVLPDADFRDDAMLTTAANNALTLNVTVPDGVEATAQDGNLTLTGTVGYGTERAAAELAVAGLTGVRNVRDEIEISYDADAVDVDLHVQEALARSALVPDDSDVKVATDGSIITLTGHVRTWAEHDAVVGAPGWRAVSSTWTTSSKSPADQLNRGAVGMTAQQSTDTTPDARASPASPRPGGRRSPAVRRVVHGLQFVALAAGVFSLLRGWAGSPATPRAYGMPAPSWSRRC